MEERLRMCFNTVPISEDDVKSILRKLSIARTQNQGKTMLLDACERFRDATPYPTSISNAMRNVLDECFNTYIAGTPAIDNFANGQSDEWAKVFESYLQSVPDRMRDHVQEIKACGDFDKLPADVQPILDNCHLKAKLILADQFSRESFVSFPFMSVSVLPIIESHLARISASIHEVSALPLISHKHCFLLICTFIAFSLAHYFVPALGLVVPFHPLGENFPEGLGTRLRIRRYDARNSCPYFVQVQFPLGCMGRGKSPSSFHIRSHLFLGRHIYF